MYVFFFSKSSWPLCSGESEAARVNGATNTSRHNVLARRLHCGRRGGRKRREALRPYFTRKSVQPKAREKRGAVRRGEPQKRAAANFYFYNP